MLTEDCTYYSKNEVIAFITNSCLNLHNFNNITCEQLVVTAVTSNALLWIVSENTSDRYSYNEKDGK